MGPRWARTGLAWTVAGGLTLGCQSSGERHSYSDDPLLQTQQYVAGMVSPEKRELIADSEPAPPPRPAIALASADLPNHDTKDGPPPDPQDAASADGPAPAAETAGKNVEASTAVRTGHAGAVTATPASRRLETVPYGNAPDYTWLQGVLEKHYLGPWTLRYTAAEADDYWGGKVVLEKDVRLADFKDGDIVRVEGDMENIPAASTGGGWSHPPHYRLREIKLAGQAQ